MTKELKKTHLAQRHRQGPESRPDKRTKVKQNFSIDSILIATIACISVLAYLNTLNNGFVLDDHTAITDNYLVKAGVRSVPKLLTTNYHFGWSDIGNLYRPLSLVIFSILYNVFGPYPLPFHAFNVVVFAADSVLLYLFLNSLFDKKKTFLAFTTSVLFALHPIHTEVVANIKSCDELLCFFFSFLCLNTLISFAKVSNRYLLIAGCSFFLLALLSKETAITLVALVPFILLLYRNEDKRRSLYITVSVIITSCIYFVARYLVLTHYHQADNNIDAIENELAANGLNHETRFATAVWILGYYLRLLIAPYPLVCDYSFNSISYVSITDTGFIVSLSVYLFLVIFALIRLKRNSRDLYAFGIMFFIITLSLFSNVVFLLGTTMAERFLFFCSVGFCFVLALVIEQLLGVDDWGFKKILREKLVHLTAIFLPICVAYSILTVSRNANWLDNRTLYLHDSYIFSNNARLNYYMGDEMLRPAFSGKAEEMTNGSDRRKTSLAALPYLYRAISIYPQYALAENDLGLAYMDMGKFDSAEAHYKIAYRYYPHSSTVTSGIAGACYFNKDYFQSALYNKRLLELVRPDPSNYLNIGYCYFLAGRFDSAIVYSKKGLAIFPNENVFNKNIALAFLKTGNTDSASKYEAISQVVDPGFSLKNSNN